MVGFAVVLLALAFNLIASRTECWRLERESGSPGLLRLLF